MGIAARRNWNQVRRGNGNEPEPGFGAGVKRWARYLRRAGTRRKEKPHGHASHRAVQPTRGAPLVARPNKPPHPAYVRKLIAKGRLP